MKIFSVNPVHKKFVGIKVDYRDYEYLAPVELFIKNKNYQKEEI